MESLKALIGKYGAISFFVCQCGTSPLGRSLTLIMGGHEFNFMQKSRDLLDLFNHGNGCKRRKHAIQAIVLTTIWCIWKARNEVEFNRKRRSHQHLFEELKSTSFLWVKHRAK
ncbi:hypothetical protein R6Q59_031828 [Mikania micrantha]